MRAYEMSLEEILKKLDYDMEKETMKRFHSKHPQPAFFGNLYRAEFYKNAILKEVEWLYEQLESFEKGMLYTIRGDGHRGEYVTFAVKNNPINDINVSISKFPNPNCMKIWINGPCIDFSHSPINDNTNLYDLHTIIKYGDRISQVSPDLEDFPENAGTQFYNAALCMNTRTCYGLKKAHGENAVIEGKQIQKVFDMLSSDKKRLYRNALKNDPNWPEGYSRRDHLPIPC